MGTGQDKMARGRERGDGTLLQNAPVADGEELSLSSYSKPRSAWPQLISVPDQPTGTWNRGRGSTPPLHPLLGDLGGNLPITKSTGVRVHFLILSGLQFDCNVKTKIPLLNVFSG